MASNQNIRRALERARRAIELRPGIARDTMTTHLRLEEGVCCTCRYGDWQFDIDEPTAVGGDGKAPSPGVYALSALAACVAMSIKMQAVLAGLHVDAVSVNVEADYDDRGSYGIDGIAPGFEGFRLRIGVESTEAESVLRELVDQAVSSSSWFNTFAKPQQISTDVSITAAGSRSPD